MGRVGIDMSDRVRQLAALLKQLVDGQAYADVQERFMTLFDQISTDELAQAENLLVAEGVTVEAIQRASAKHTDLVTNAIKPAFAPGITPPHQVPGHPAFVLKGENQGINDFITGRLRPDLDIWLNSQAEEDRLNLLSDARELLSIDTHYKRKENVLFPYLERAGITTPPQVMWGVDDIIRALMKLFVGAIDQQPAQPERIRLIADRLLAQVERMIVQENDILLPMLAGVMNDADWILAAQESVHIGYVFNKGITGASNSDAATWLLEKTGGVMQEPDQPEDKIRLPSGNFTVAQLTAMLNTLPTDLTFIDSDDVIQYYSEGKHQVFTRTRTIIGRNVYLCHPPLLVPRIKKLIEAFRSGQKDEAIVPVRKGSRLDLVRYYAVRDDEGTYLGTVEVTEEVSGLLEKLGK
jgi:hypothetical protein